MRATSWRSCGSFTEDWFPMRRLVTLALGVALLTSVAGLRAEELKSGPAVGDRVGAFTVEKCAGAEDGVSAGDKLCYV